MRTGAVVDRVQFMNERLVLQRNRSCVSWSLRDDTLVVLCPSAQQVHVYHVSGDSLVHNRTLGAHLRHDDELVVSNLAAKEQRHRCSPPIVLVAFCVYQVQLLRVTLPHNVHEFYSVLSVL